MKDNRLGGIALIIGAVCGVITMILHPVSSGHALSPGQFEKLAILLVGVHALAIASIPFLFLGAFALTRRLDSPDRIALAALVCYTLSLVAVLVAPAISGLVGTNILRRLMAQSSPRDQWRLLLDYNHLINQAFTEIYVAASGAAIGLWSVVMVKGRSFSPAIGYYGLFLTVAIAIALPAGLRLDVHGFGLIVFGEAIWLIVTGIRLMRSQISGDGPKGPR